MCPFIVFEYKLVNSAPSEIYGDLATQAVATNIAGPDIETVTVTKLTLRDALPDHGIISHMTFGVTMQGVSNLTYFLYSFICLNLTDDRCW